MSKKKIIVTGDKSWDRFIYIEQLPDESSNSRDAWVNASQFWNIVLPGGTGIIIECLNMDDKIKAFDPCETNNYAESIYILTRQKVKQKDVKDNENKKRWWIEKAIVAGECKYPSMKLKECLGEDDKNAPIVIIDYNQGWLDDNKEDLSNLLTDRSYIIRTHDPSKKEWEKIRKGFKKGFKPGIWFSPIQDIADGSLNFPGKWEKIRKRLIEYFQDDKTLWDKQNKKWRHYIVIQISYDGVFIVGPEITEEDGKLLVFKGDQKESFERKGYGVVGAGGVVVVYSLTQELLNSRSWQIDEEILKDGIRNGLVRIRNIAEKGYWGPRVKKDGWIEEVKKRLINLPIECLDNNEEDDQLKYKRGNVIEYVEPKADWETACNIVGGNEELFSENTVLTLGKFSTAYPDYAHTILGFTGRLDNHVKSERKEVLSFSIFGGPGSGKSFIARQIAAAVDIAGDKFEEKIFNLSQFKDEGHLLSAFEEIQSISLTDKIPFVLWDEFDTYVNKNRAGWLSSFLMPMQDGEFQDGKVKQKLGKCVFVFIGGTFKDDSDFNIWTKTEEGKKLKGPDFHSRLDRSLAAPSVDLKGFSKEIKDIKKKDYKLLIN